MKKLYTLLLLFVFIFGFANVGHALRVFTIPQGGTGTGDIPANEEILIGDGSGNYVVDSISNYSGISDWEILGGVLTPTSTITLAVATTTITGDFTVADSDANSTFYVDNNNGRVGIGTDSPTGVFEVYGGPITFKSPGGESRFNFVPNSDSSNSYFEMFNSQQVRNVSIATGDNSWFLGGNIGIATTTPTSKLTIEGDGTTSATYGLNVTDSTGKNILEVRDDSNTIFTAATGTAPVLSVNYPDGTTNFEVRTGYEGDNNLFIGDNSGTNIQSGGIENVAIGYGTLDALTTGDRNFGLGYNAGGRLTTGGSNVAIGYSALGNAQTSNASVAIGQASFSNATGGSNVGLGASTGLSNVGGQINTYIGQNAGYSNVEGDYNIAIGYEALKGVTGNSHSNNIVMGFRAGTAVTTGSSNLLLGHQAGNTLTSGERNILIGYDVDAAATQSNYLSIGNLLFGNGIDGTGTTVSSGNIGIATTTPWGRLSVKGDDTDPSFVVGDVSNNTDFIVAADGKVGIGTDSPTESLTVYGTGAGASGRTWAEVINTQTGSAAGIKLTNGNDRFGAFQYSGSDFSGVGEKFSIYTQGDYPIDFSTNGVAASGGSSYITFSPGGYNNETVRFTADGSIGIATTTPTSKLTIEGDGTTSATYGLNVTDSTGAPIMVVRDDGRVGIGTDSPGTELEIVNGTLRFSPTSYAESMQFYRGASKIGRMDNTGSDLNFYSGSGSDLNMYNFQSQGFTIKDSSGNIGIATTTPGGTYGEKLTVVGDAYITGDLNVGGKITSVGGVDPPYVSFTNENCETIKERREVEDVKDDVMLFWNTDNERFEYYHEPSNSCLIFNQTAPVEPKNNYLYLLGLFGLVGLIPIKKLNK